MENKEEEEKVKDVEVKDTKPVDDILVDDEDKVKDEKEDVSTPTPEISKRMEDEIAKLKEQLESKDKEILALRKALDVRIRASTGSSFPDLHAALAPSVEATVGFEKILRTPKI